MEYRIRVENGPRKCGCGVDHGTAFDEEVVFVEWEGKSWYLACAFRRAMGRIDDLERIIDFHRNNVFA